MSEFVDALRHNQLFKNLSWAFHGVMAPKYIFSLLDIMSIVAKLAGVAWLTFGAANCEGTLLREERVVSVILSVSVTEYCGM